MKTAFVSFIILAGALPSPGGVSLTTLLTFGGTNGSNPGSALLQTANGNLYGTLQAGYYGSAYELTTNGEFIPLQNVSLSSPSGLVQRKYDGSFYCTADNEVVEFDANGFTSLDLNWDYSSAVFDGTNGAAPSPFAGLTEGADGNFYGTTTGGGLSGNGTIFQVTFNGRIRSLYSFTGGSDGANPLGGLIQASNGVFYGTTAEGGWNNAGTIFSAWSAEFVGRFLWFGEPS